MRYRPLGRTHLQVSLISLGTMTWGEQNTEDQAHAQIDLALDMGVNLIDTAEMYPVPPSPQTQGLTEQYIGTWLQKTGRRQDIILASKATGPSHQAARPSHIRGGQLRFTRANLHEAVHQSLRRLQTDYIDLYQLHWPDRPVNNFGQLGLTELKPDDNTSFEETLDALTELVQAGKIRHIAVSNETPWGVCQFLKLAEVRQQPRIASIQNPYSLLNRTYEIGLAEVSLREDVGLLAYSPLGMGVLSGKYLHGQQPAGARLTLFNRFVRYNSNHNAVTATQAYVELFQQHGIDPAQGALAFVNQRRFVTSNIIGATTLEQLRSNIESVNVTLSDELLASIEAIHDRYPNPSP